MLDMLLGRVGVLARPTDRAARRQNSSPPAPGPDASPAERSRAHEALAAYRHGVPATRLRALLAGSNTKADG
jgi:hypothetical protein